MNFESLGLHWGWEIERLVKVMDWRTPDNMYIRTHWAAGKRGNNFDCDGVFRT